MVRRSKGQSVGQEPDRTALLVIDVQRGLFKRSTPIYNAERLLDNIRTLVARAHRARVPVIYIQHSNRGMLAEGSEDWQLHRRLRPAGKDLIIFKCSASAFQTTPLAEELTARRVSQVVITGLVTHGCVRATCLDAKKLGYRVVLVQDGHSNYSPRAAHLIDEWNRKLSFGTVVLKPTTGIDFRD